MKFLTIILLVFSINAFADEIELPPEELARESVYPKFDRPDVVKSQNIKMTSKIEFGVYYGWKITEPIYNQGKFGGWLGYHWNESSGLLINFSSWLTGLNQQYTDGITSASTNLSDSTDYLDFTRLPKKKMSVFLQYDWTLFYGKISFTKQGVTNLFLYPIFGAGMTAYEHKNYPGFEVGVGQKIMFGKTLAFRTDVKLLASQYPSPFLGDNEPPLTDQPSLRTKNPKPEFSEFTDKYGLDTLLDIGLTLIF
jgi:outer membrane beta-barrel protein